MRRQAARDAKTAARPAPSCVALARPQPNGTAKIEPFMTGLLDTATNEFYGRPAYVFPMADGSLLVSDEHNGAIYRISYGAPPRQANR